MNKELTILQADALALLKELIATPSFSKEEEKTAGVLARFFATRGIAATWVGNNIFALNKYYDESKPTILLNSHHDTVRPNPQYTKDPFQPLTEDGKLYGLGSNDAGGCLVSLIATFLYFYEQENLNYNIIVAATAEEEISGTGGIEYALTYLPQINCAIVGEPTQMQMAVAERGLMVLDCTSHGKAGHAARNEGENAIYKALKDMEWFRTFQFEKVSPLLGPSKMNVTVIETENKAHNVVPAVCRFVVDTRINELYSFEEVIDIIRSHVACEVKPRSTRLRSTSIALDHPLVKAGLSLGREYYGSPTTSDKALMPFPALKMGPGDSARSHTADEFISLDEINQGIELYIQLLNQVV
ncbi:MAG: M20 family metallo-hydrolase [Chitinophagaceae bacterium]|nr:M20 family metallo-hydrolase [Chitinophagaceae bacterium]